MSAEGKATSPSDHFSSSLEQLVTAAATLRQVSAALSKPVSTLEDALKHLNLGVACFENLKNEEDPYGNYDRWDVGYARHSGRWGIVVKHTIGSHQHPDQDGEEIWPFNDAPRFMRAKAVDKLPNLIQGLIEVANGTAKKLASKIEFASQLAETATALLSPKKK